MAGLRRVVTLGRAPGGVAGKGVSVAPAGGTPFAALALALALGRRAARAAPRVVLALR